MRRHAEIVGAGFAGLTAAIALLQRGWTARVHERSPSLRSEGFGIAIQQNGLRTLEALSLGHVATAHSVKIKRRIICDASGKPTADLGITQHQIRISRRVIIAAMATKVAELGGEIITNSEAIAVDAGGALLLARGLRCPADVLIAADGHNSLVRDSAGLKPKIRFMRDGAFRLVIERTPGEQTLGEIDSGVTYENWSGHRRLICSPCSRNELYVAMSCLASDQRGLQIPLDRNEWERSFPHLRHLFERIERETDWSLVKWSQFKTITLPRWSIGKVAVVGDAAHAMPPNLAQGGGCAMMNALSLATSIGECSTIEPALKNWEWRERTLIEHTQRWSRLYGVVTAWPEAPRVAAFKIVERSPWLQKQLQKAARHRPYGWDEASEGICSA